MGGRKIRQLNNIASIGIHDKNLTKSRAIRIESNPSATWRPSGQSTIGWVIRYIPQLASLRVQSIDFPTLAEPIGAHQDLRLLPRLTIGVNTQERRDQQQQPKRPAFHNSVA